LFEFYQHFCFMGLIILVFTWNSETLKQRPQNYHKVSIYMSVPVRNPYQLLPGDFLHQCCKTLLHSRHTNPTLHIWGGGDWLRLLLINWPQPKNVLFDVHNYPYLLLCHLF
jgi:hypothetical protein